MKAPEQPKTLGELAALVEGAVRGDAGRRIRGVNDLADAGPDELAFYASAKFKDALARTRAGALIVREEDVELLGGRDGIVSHDPPLAFARIATAFHPRPELPAGIDPRAVIEAGARIDPTATVMALAYVGEGASVGPHAVLFPGVYVGEGSRIGAEALLYPGVVVRERCVVGERSILQPGVVVGADGFGYVFDFANGRHFKVPQIGTAEIGPDVEVGANSAIDRATLGATRVGQGTKIDNLVQLGHNVQIGPLCILCGQVGIAGSSVLGTAVICGGQVGIADHVKIADGARIGAQSGVMANVEEGGEYVGSPIQPSRDWLRSQSALRKGADTAREVRRLEKRVEELEAKLASLTKG